MVCPACGHEQPEGFECLRCGIVFAKWEEHRRRTAGMSRSRGWRRPVGRVARWSRVLVAIGGLALAVLMLLNGIALRSFGPFLALVFFLGTSMYLLLSVRERISTGRLAVEASLWAVASLVLYGALPEVFSLQKPLYTEALHDPPPEAARQFLDAARSFRDAARRFLETEEVPDAREAKALLAPLDVEEHLDGPYRALPVSDQGLTRGVWMRLRSLAPFFQQVGARMEKEMPAGPARFLPAPLVREVAGQLQQATEDLEVAEAEISRRERLFRGEAGAGEEARPAGASASGSPAGSGGR